MKKIFADMHTHSENSHDSVCPLEEMALSQLEKGTTIFAVTDHFDTSLYCGEEDLLPIIKSCETCVSLNKELQGKIKILKGIELGEGFWNADVYNQVKNLLEYDVIIGSVHAVKYKDILDVFSRVDFSALPREDVFEYTDAYFDDMITMIDTLDFDVLAHITNLFKYTNGKYKLNVDITPYEEKIELILKKIIKKGIALEVNTSCTELLGDFMPTREIIKKYYDMGGRLITLGSDAHFSRYASAHFDKAVDFLKKTGFENIYYYEKRKPVPIKL